MNRLCYGISFLAAAALVLVIWQARGQQPGVVSGVLPAPDDPELFAAFFQSFEMEYAWLERPGPRGPLTPEEERRRVASKFRVAAADLAKIIAIARSVNTGAKNIHDQVQVYVQQKRARNEMPDRNLLLGLELKRQQLIASAVEQLKRELGTAGWNGLRSYVNDSYRLNLRQIPIPRGVPPPGTTGARQPPR